MKRLTKIFLISLISAGIVFALSLLCFSMMTHKTYNYRMQYHTVSEGQTWWGICGKYFYSQDKYGHNQFGEFVSETINLNRAKNRHLQVGEVVMIKLETEARQK